MKRITSKLSCGNRAYTVALCAATVISLPAQTFTTLVSFDGTDGANPVAALVQATNGDLYGTTSYGGANNQGTVFKITPSGALTVLYSLCSQMYCTDGARPDADLVQATNGDLYGTTYSGVNGYGTIFKITLGGALTTLYTFCAQPGCADGENPTAGLVQATNGDFYGTTYGGGAYGSYGTVFKITPSGKLTTLYSFCGNGGECADGAYPYAGLVQATNGNLYGTTLYGGAHNQNGGTVFKITPSGTLTTIYSFCPKPDCPDGDVPVAGLVQASNGDFYGTTRDGGTEGEGTVFKITPTGTLTTLYSFCPNGGECTDGADPNAGLVQATDGDFYGTTTDGGAYGDGTIFKITPTGAVTALHSFDGTDGKFPYAGLVQDTNGKFYGTTQYGGTSSACGGCGTVFSLSVGLAPFVETLPTSGKVGAAVKILGSDLTGATSVTFNGAAAAFTVVSRTLITTTVPAGATSGKIQVVTPSRTLSSNVPFRVP